MLTELRHASGSEFQDPLAFGLNATLPICSIPPDDRNKTERWEGMRELRWYVACGERAVGNIHVLVRLFLWWPFSYMQKCAPDTQATDGTHYQRLLTLRHYFTFNRWRTVVSATWKYDDPRLNMSHEGAARVWHVARTTVCHMFCRLTNYKNLELYVSWNHFRLCICMI